MKKAFISYSYLHREDYKRINTMLRGWLKKNYGTEATSFVYDYTGSDTCYLMMKEALSLIDDSDVLIAEMTHNPIGVGLEVGYAKGRDKTIIYIHQAGSELSQTVKGVSDYLIEYSSADDLLDKLESVMKQMTRPR